MEETTGNKHDVKRLVKKIMNKTAIRRLISKQEACVLLANLPLSTCSEITCNVSIAKNLKITSSACKTKNVSVLHAYETRHPRYYHKSLREYFKIERELNNRPFAIPHFVGIKGTPTYPVTKEYARQTIIVDKPWTVYPYNRNWIREFDSFITSKTCPKIVPMEYDRVVQRHFNGTKFVDPTSNDCPPESLPPESEDKAAVLLAGMAGHLPQDYDETIFSSIHRGREYKWDDAPKVRQEQIV